MDLEDTSTPTVKSGGRLTTRLTGMSRVVSPGPDSLMVPDNVPTGVTVVVAILKVTVDCPLAVKLVLEEFKTVVTPGGGLSSEVDTVPTKPLMLLSDSV